MIWEHTPRSRGCSAVTDRLDFAGEALWGRMVAGYAVLSQRLDFARGRYYGGPSVV